MSRKKQKEVTKFTRTFRAQGGRCALCGHAISPGSSSREHIFPKHLFAKGQDARHRNILLTHHKCNNNRGDAMPTDYDYHFLSAVNIILEQAA